MRREPYREKEEIETIDPGHRRLLFEELRRGIGIYTGAIGIEKRSTKEPLLNFVRKNLGQKTKDYRELLGKWIFEDSDSDDIFSFTNICKIFSLDIKEVRRMVKEEPDKINEKLEEIKRGEKTEHENC